MHRLVSTAVLLYTATLVGCTEYLDRRESVSFGAGNAQQVNLITHVVSPLPSHAADRDLRFHGERMGDAVARFRTGEAPGPAAETEAQEPAAAVTPGDAAMQ